jgi:hypothetical protein
MIRALPDGAAAGAVTGVAVRDVRAVPVEVSMTVPEGIVRVSFPSVEVST